MSTDSTEFINDLDGGVLAEKLSRALSETAGAVVDTGQKGNVRFDAAFSRIGDSHQVECKVKLVFSRPTMRGKVMEENTTITPFYVGAKGQLSLFPEGQKFNRDKAAAAAPAKEHKQ